MEQLIFELARPEPPTFANFVAGRNGEAIQTLRAIAAGANTETGVVLWGAVGGGKSHLLQAAVAAARRAGRATQRYERAADVEDRAPEAGALIAIDDVDAADATSQGRIFTLYNALAATRGQLVVASAAAPAGLSLRDDLRTRLSHGLVFEIVPLADAEKAAAIGHYAHERGFSLSSDVIGYLLAHGRRDMASLVATLSALDRHSMSTKRAITIPLLRDWLQRNHGAGSNH